MCSHRHSYQLEDCGVRVPRKFRRRQDLPLNAQVRKNLQIYRCILQGRLVFLENPLFYHPVFVQFFIFLGGGGGGESKKSNFLAQKVRTSSKMYKKKGKI